jgi:hypothetical protein
MELTAHGVWTMVHGMGFGALYLLACSGAMVELWRHTSSSRGAPDRTADDGELGEQHLLDFQDNEKTIPTILTTSQKLSTGVDARNIRNIVLMRPINTMLEFKQIIGRGRVHPHDREEVICVAGCGIPR